MMFQKIVKTRNLSCGPDDKQWVFLTDKTDSAWNTIMPDSK